MASSLLYSQNVIFLQTKWNDDFSQWDYFDSKDYNVGHLNLRWLNQNNWAEWEYNLFNVAGQIKLKWKNDPNEWEIRGDNEIVSSRTLWRNKFREWRITNNNEQFTLRARYGNNFDRWETRDSRFYMETIWEGDPREWKITWEDSTEISPSQLTALIFTAMFNSLPE